MSDNILIDVSTTLENVNVEVVEASAASIGIEYFYPQGPVGAQGPVGPQGPAGQSIWGTISGTLSAQSDLWKYLSAETFSPSQLTAFLNSNAISLCSINVNGTILSAGTDLFDIFLTSETDSQTLSYIPSSYLLSISNGNTVNLSSIITTFAANSGKYENVFTNVQTNSANWILDGGNTKGANILVGTNDPFSLNLESNGLTRLSLLSSGLITIAGSISGLANTTTSFNTGSATGNLSFAVNNGRAFGQRSFAQGNNTIASGSNTAVFGSASQATGTTSFAKGTSTQATNTNANAEGSSTVASGQASHAEGTSTTAGPGNNSHAEGLRSVASGAQSHAEGTDTQATASNSHAEGDNARATGLRSHAEGLDTIASGSNSHAEGDATQATNINAHAEGFETIASGQHSHSQNLRTQAIGNMSHAGGRNSIAQGNISFVHGNESRATGEKSFAIGETVHAIGSSSIAMGVCAIAAHDNSFIWSGIGSPVDPISTTCPGQFYIKPDCGVYIDGDLTVVKDVSAQIVYAQGGNSNQWNNAYNTGTIYQANSGSYAPYSFVNSNFLNLTGGTIEGNLTLSGNFYVAGSAAVINAVDLVITDPLIFLAEGNPSDILDIGFTGSYNFDGDPHEHTGLVRSHSTKKWTLFSGLTTELLSALTINFNDPSLQIDTLRANLEGNVVGGSVQGTTLSSTGLVYAQGGNSNNWNTAFNRSTVFSLVSSRYNSSSTVVESNSANWILDGGNTKNSNITIGTNNNFNLNFETANSTRVTVTSSGNVGINTLTPVTKLNIEGDFSTNSAIKVGSLEIQPYAVNNVWFGDNVYYDGVNFTRRENGAAGLFYFQGTEGQFRFADTDAAGTAITPTIQLKISKDGKFGVGSQIDFNTDSFTGSNFYVSELGDVGNGTTTPLRKYHQEGGKFLINSDQGSYGQFQIVNPDATEVSFVFAAEGTVETDGSLTSTDSNYIWAFGAGTFGQTPDVFTIGNLGYGTSMFHVYANGVVNPLGGFVVGTQVDGYVDNGGHKAQIVAPDASNQTPLTLIGGSAQMEMWKDSSPSKAVSFGMAIPGNSPEDDLIFTLYNGSSWSEGFRVQDTTGNFGIGTSAPNEKLTVSGNISATESIFATSILSGGVDLKDIFLTSETDSQTLTFTESAAQLTISNGNTVSLSSLQSNYIYTAISQNALSNHKYAFDTSNSSLTATLPASPQIGDEIEFFDITGYWFINNLVIANNGNYIEQRLETLECDVRFGSIQLIFVGPIDNIGWRIIPKPRHSVPSIIAPSVSISSDIDLGYDPILINFAGVNNLNNIIAPIENWYWNLTGGNTPDYFTQNVSFNYSTPGVYTVNLTASNAAGTGTASKTITALPVLVPVPAISSNLVSLTASFVGFNTLPVSSSPVTNWYWNLTGGNTADYTTQTVTYVYETSGNYTVNLSASNASGTGTASVTASPIAGDPFFNNVSLLMNMDSNFSDQSLNNYSFSQFGTPSINTSIKKFGAGSGYFDSSGDYLTSSSSSLFGFGTGDFTIEMWIYPTGTGSFQGLFCVGDYQTGILIRWHANATTDSLYINGNTYPSYDWFPMTAAPVNTWTHVALVRQSGNIKFFAGGIDRLVGSPVNTSDLGSTGVPLIGASSHNTSEGFNGYIDEIRVTKGIARYTSNFTPPPEPFLNF